MTPPAHPLSVLVADPHLATRAGLRVALEDGGLEVVAEAARAKDAVERASVVQPDISLVAAKLPGGALRAVGGILGQAPNTAVIVLAEHPTDEECMAAVLAGAVGYVHRDVEPERLLRVVEAVAAGEAAVPRALVAAVLRELRIMRESRRERLDHSRDVQLTNREWEVLALLDAGLQTIQIAERLRVTPVTVRRHISRLMARLGVAGREEALATLRAAAGRSEAPQR